MKHLSIFIASLALIAFYSCSSSESGTSDEDILVQYDTIIDNSDAAAKILRQQPDRKWNQPLLVDAPGAKSSLKNNFEGRYAEVFNDSNYLQVAAAESIGITPVSDMASAWNINRPLELIASCEEYYLEELTHSFPFLVPEGAKLLKEIGTRFNQLLMERGKNRYRIKVTSVLRTPETIKDLMKVNKNSVANSAHSYGTTIDISYANFIVDQKTNTQSNDDLVKLLAEVLHEFQSQGRCYVKFESKQSCFHLTVRPSN